MNRGNKKGKPAWTKTVLLRYEIGEEELEDIVVWSPQTTADYELTRLMEEARQCSGIKMATS